MELRHNWDSVRPSAAVQINNAGKAYGTFQVFQGVNMDVPEGAVYGLLGPSGCGKTSLLRCILGRLQLDRGSILAFGHRPGSAESGVPGSNAGYMPQETCILETLTIDESWTYYGTISGLSKNKITVAAKYFIQLLGLPPSNTLTGNLSGGEVRRVAFAAALMHKPKLLILDEPTVGIDIITKHRMWEHLLRLARVNGTSIILTTHYIEEARAAHKVGLMHGGTLAVEDETGNLLRRFGCINLEDVFLKICCSSPEPEVVKTDDKGGTCNSTTVWIPIVSEEQPEKRVNRINNMADITNNNTSISSLKLRDFYVRSHILKAVTTKTALNFMRFPGAVIFVIFLPAIFLFICVYALSLSLHALPIGVVDEDSDNLSSQFLSIFHTDLINLKMLNGTGASEALWDGIVRGLIVIPENFSKNFIQMLKTFPMTSSEALNSSKISFDVDNVDLNIGYALKIHAYLAFQEFLHLAYNESGMKSVLAEPILKLDEETLDNLSSIDKISMKFGIIILLSYFVPAIVFVFSLFAEKTRGHLEMCITLGVSPAEIIAGLFSFTLLIAAVQIALMTIVGYFMFLDTLGPGLMLLVYCVLLFHGLSGAGFGVLLSLTCNDMIMLILVASDVVIISGTIIGAFWPMESMPYFIQQIIIALPQALPFRAIEAIYFQRSFYLWQVLYALILTSSWTLIFIFIALILLIKT